MPHRLVDIHDETQMEITNSRGDTMNINDMRQNFQDVMELYGFDRDEAADWSDKFVDEIQEKEKMKKIPADVFDRFFGGHFLFNNRGNK